VLLVVLESVSGAYLPSLAADHGRVVPPRMPELDAMARAHLSFSTFITQQRKTNRGLYALLCGDLPNLLPAVPKMTTYPDAGGRACLPRLLGEAGYTTAYLQAAPLAFMLKSQFMPRAGFARVEGNEAFERHYARSVWGVDDRAFFERALASVDALRAETSPWFLTLLNVGTHHPFVIPDDFLPEESDRRVRSMAYLDRALAEFVEALRARGVLENTLVILTSDESLGARGGAADAIGARLTENWGVLVALAPDLPPRRVVQPVVQSDVALSILDYLGLAEPAAHLFGRSIFRDYSRPRRVFFANSNILLVGAVDASGDLLLCRDGLRRCGRFAPEGGRVFAPRRVRRAWDDADDADLREVARRSVAAPDAAPLRRDFALVGAPLVALDPGEPLVIHGGQHVDVRPGEWLEVDVEVSVDARGGGGGEVEIHHKLKGRRPPALFVETVRIEPGETFRLHYTYAPDAPVAEIQCHALARVISGEGFDLHFRRARLSLHGEGTRPASGVRVVRNEVVPSR
jgi:hypothetical protein